MQTTESHAAVKEVLEINTDEDSDNVERYLQALAVATRPIEPIISDLLTIASEKFNNEKIEATLIQTIGSMAFRYARLPNQTYSSPIVRKVEKFLTKSLADCKGIACREQFLNGLRNLQSPETVDILLMYLADPERSISVGAAKAIRHFPTKTWTPKIRQVFEDIFFQKAKRFDSSTRTLVLDILFELKPTEEELRSLIGYLKSSDKAYEVKKYLLEKVIMLSDRCGKFQKVVQGIFDADQGLKNYHILGQKG